MGIIYFLNIIFLLFLYKKKLTFVKYLSTNEFNWLFIFYIKESNTRARLSMSFEICLLKTIFSVKDTYF